MAQDSRRSGPTRASEGRAGLFITLEGGEGAGKSLQAGALGDRLRQQGMEVVVTREPGGTPLGERAREILLDAPQAGARLAVDPLAETLLFMAARAQLIADVIAPALASGAVVVCDRFADSTRAYQAFGRGVELQVIDELNAVAAQGIRPDLTVLLDLPVGDGLARTGEGGQADRFGREDESFHERVRRGYQTLAAREPDRWLVVDATQAPEVVTDEIWRRVGPLLPQK